MYVCMYACIHVYIYIYYLSDFACGQVLYFACKNSRQFMHVAQEPLLGSAAAISSIFGSIRKHGPHMDEENIA